MNNNDPNRQSKKRKLGEISNDQKKEEELLFG